MAIPRGAVRVPCPLCKGKGVIPTPDGKRWQICPRCGGSGYINVSVDFLPWRPDVWYHVACPR